MKLKKLPKDDDPVEEMKREQRESMRAPKVQPAQRKKMARKRG